mmetsp:Transcript_51133/g.157695  ORF Transcript_51133/g.157695 Transcript_51133/m.157695 type:complete len:352 (-) Transcript_51133:17-1072(-)
MHDEGDLGDVEAARRDVGGDEELGEARLEHRQAVQALLLRQQGVERRDGEAEQLQREADDLAADARVDEDDRGLRLVAGAQQAHEELQLDVQRHEDVLLGKVRRDGADGALRLQRLGRRAAHGEGAGVGDAQLREQALGGVRELRVDGGAQHERAAERLRGAERGDGGEGVVAHVALDEAVGLVQHEEGDVARRRRRLRERLEEHPQPPGGADDDVRPRLNCLELLAVRGAADDDGRAQRDRGPEGDELVQDLVRQLAARRHDEAEHPVRLLGHTLQHRQGVGGRLAAARRRAGHDVLAAEHSGDRGPLHLRRRRNVQRRRLAHQPARAPQLLERGALGRRRRLLAHLLRQ